MLIRHLQLRVFKAAQTRIIAEKIPVTQNPSNQNREIRREKAHLMMNLILAKTKRAVKWVF